MINIDGLLTYVIVASAIGGWCAIEFVLWLLSFITIGLV